jgi:hypothetical protein
LEFGIGIEILNWSLEFEYGIWSWELKLGIGFEIWTLNFEFEI